jgi:multiple sugar transport system substrate-binding protein
MMKRFSFKGSTLPLMVLLVVLLSLALAACGDPTATPAPATTAAPAATTAKAATAATTAAAGGAPVTLEMWIMPNTGKSVDDMNKVLEGFNQQNPNIKVNVTEVSWGDALTKITTALQSGVGPDVTQVGTTWVGGFAATKGLRPFTAEEIQAMGGKDAYSQAAWDTSHMLGSNEIVAMPWFVETRALYYRTDLVKKAGLDPNTAFKDWDTFIESLKKMKDAQEGLVKAPFAITGKSDWNVVHNPMPWLWGAGGDILNGEGTKAVINSPEAIKGVTYYANLYNQGLTLKEALEKNMSDLEQLWGAGSIGSFIGTPSVIANAKKPASENGYVDSITAKNMGTALLPAGPQGVKAFVGGSNLVIPKASKNQAAAVKLVQYLTSKKGQLDYQMIVGNLPALKDAQNDAFYTGNPLYKPFLEQLKTGNGKSYPEVAAWGGIETAIQKNFSLMWDDVAAGKTQTAVKERLDATAKEIDTLLAATK